MAQKRLTGEAQRQRLKDRAALKQKHKGKRPDQITDAEVLEWARQEMLAALSMQG